jgi:hypothetical protein
MLNLLSHQALKSRLPFFFLRNQPILSTPHNIASQLNLNLRHSTPTLFRGNKHRTAICIPACTLQNNNSTATNNGRATEGKAKGLNSTTAASRVLPKTNRRRYYAALIFNF